MVVRIRNRNESDQDEWVDTHPINSGCVDGKTGQRIAEDCLSCPLRVCKHDDLQALFDWRIIQEGRALVDSAPALVSRMLRKNHTREEVAALAEKEQVCSRTIWRRIKVYQAVTGQQLALNLPSPNPD